MLQQLVMTTAHAPTPRFGGHMKTLRLSFGLLLVSLAAASWSSSDSRWAFDFETGIVLSGYNDVRIPRDSGTLLSLSEELDTDPSFFGRGWLEYRPAERHTIGVLVAPLRLQAKGSVAKIVRFEGEEFPAFAPLKATYEFNSYRLTYRYDVHRSPRLKIGVGLTAKIRDALVRLESNGRVSEKTNTGFVPLINFAVDWKIADRLNLIVGGDALAAPQGRAEDVLCALQYTVSPKMRLRFGYRILEGGADVEEVYNFTLLHYVVTGVTLEL